MKIGILVTGGMDSTTMMYMAADQPGDEIYPITVDYGHSAFPIQETLAKWHEIYPITVDYGHSAFPIQETLAKWHVEALRKRKLETIINPLQNINVQFHPFQRHSQALFDPTHKCKEVDPLREWDKMRYEKELVEGRNAIMVLYALGYCAEMQLDELWAGYLYSEDEWKRRFSVKLLLGDNSPQFVDTMNTLSMMGFSHPTRFRAPFYEQRLSKEDVFLIGSQHSIDYSKTHTFLFPAINVITVFFVKKLWTNMKSKNNNSARIDKHFLDSGAFSQRAKATAHYKKHGGDRWAFYETDAFWDYMKKYVRFVKKYKIAIDFYANVDAIGDSKKKRYDETHEELTWRNQLWLEKKGLCPVPVVHYDTLKPTTKWLKKYIDAGHEYIGLGGMVISGTQLSGTKRWLDDCFKLARKNPKIKFHGFGITNYGLITRYPWFSVDSTTWIKRGAFGEILVPRYDGKDFVFFREDPQQIRKFVRPSIVSVSTKHARLKSGVWGWSKMTNPKSYTDPTHCWCFKRMAKEEERKILLWLDRIGVDPVKVQTVNAERARANLEFFCAFANALPKHPWPLTVFLSGGGAEDYKLKDNKKVSIMLSFYANRNKPEKRFLKLYKYRKKQKENRHV